MTKTTVITRLYADEASARGVRERLYREGFPRHTLSLVSAAEGDTEETLKAKMERALVPAEAAEAYATRIAEGASLVAVRATYKPLGAVRIANETFASSGALPVNLPSESFRVKAPRDHAPSVLKDHPRFLTMHPRSDERGGPVSAQLGFRLLSEPKRRDSVINGGKLFFGDGVKRGRTASSAMRGGGHMSRMFWPMPLLSKKKRGLSVIEGGGHPFSRRLGWPTR
ncbi:MAG: hypothetical protein QNJ20_11165 [Paracoccaceae bacterium]|nr:hypothetical protein [Paracoccaceae bacterium]